MSRRGLCLSLIALAAACGGDGGAGEAPGDVAPETPGDRDPGTPSREIDPRAPFLAWEPPPAESPVPGSVRIGYAHVRVEVVGDIARTTVTEVMVNDGEAPVEAGFSFPLPGDATVTGFAHFLDGERIDAAAAERSAARATYERAAARGERAALAEEDGPRFTIELAPIPARGHRRVELSYTQTLTGFGGERAYVLPSARYADNPPTSLDLEVHVRGGNAVRAVGAPNHPDARVVRLAEDQVRVYLSRTREPLAPDFMARWSEPVDDIELVARAVRTDPSSPAYLELRAALHRDPRPAEREPRDVVIVVDASLSMVGEPIARARDIATGVAEALDERDTLSLITFADAVTAVDPAAATSDHRRRIVEQIAGIRARGYSNLAAALDEAADRLRDRPRGLLVLLTDAQPTVGEGVQGDLPASAAADFAAARVVLAHFNYPGRTAAVARLFSGAAVHYVPDGDAGDEIAGELVRLAVAPILDDLVLEIVGDDADARHGAIPTRLAEGEQVRVVSRAAGPEVALRLRGSLRGSPVERSLVVAIPAAPGDDGDGGLPVEWARLRARDLEHRFADSRDQALADEVRSLGTTYGLATRFTSFVATDSLSPDRIRPGDPEIRVRGAGGAESVPSARVGPPAGPDSVHAVLPWGEIVDLGWEANEEVWLGRFLVPRATPEGLYRVRIFVEEQGRTALRSTLLYRVDATAPTFTLESRYRDGEVAISAHPERAVFDRNASGDTLRLDRVDVRRVVVSVGGREVELAHSQAQLWSARIPIELPPGTHRLVLVATDYAANSSVTVEELVVPGAEGGR
jgi:hypothetical protein